MGNPARKGVLANRSRVDEKVVLLCLTSNWQFKNNRHPNVGTGSIELLARRGRCTFAFAHSPGPIQIKCVLESFFGMLGTLAGDYPADCQVAPKGRTRAVAHSENGHHCLGA